MQRANPLGCRPGQIRAVCSQSKLIAEEGVQTCQSAQKLEDKLTDHSSLIMSHILNDDLQTCIILYSSVTHNVNALQQVPTINNTSAWPKYGKTAAKNINVVYLATCKASAPAILICRAHATLPERGCTSKQMRLGNLSMYIHMSL